MLLAALAISVLMLVKRNRPSGKASNSTDSSRLAILSDQQSVFGEYAGTASCEDCHEQEFGDWQASDHALAERPLKAELDLPAFEPGRMLRHGTQQTSVWSDSTNFLVTVIGLTRTNEVPLRLEIGRNIRLLYTLLRQILSE